MQINDITNDLMRMLELKLTGHLNEGEFNQNNLTYNVMSNILENLFMKSIHDLRKTGALNVMASKQVTLTGLKRVIVVLDSEPKSTIDAFNGYLKQHQKSEIYDDASKMAEYLVGALPVLIDEYIHTNEYFLS